jgi:hypothetical protein
VHTAQGNRRWWAYPFIIYANDILVLLESVEVYEWVEKLLGDEYEKVMAEDEEKINYWIQ